MSRTRYEIEYKGKKFLVDAEWLPAEPDVGIMSDYSEDHILLDCETEERLEADESTLTTNEWEDIATKFDEAIRGFDAWGDTVEI